MVDFDKVNVSWVYNSICIYSYCCLRTSTCSLFSWNSSMSGRRVSAMFYLNDISFSSPSFIFFSRQRPPSRKLLFLFYENFVRIFKTLVANTAGYLKSLDIWRNLILLNITCLMQFELNKVETTTRCPTKCVQKTFAKSLWRRLKNYLS